VQRVAELEQGTPQTALLLPQPQELTEREKEDAMGAYLMMFAAWGAGFPLPMIGLIASIIYFHLNKKSSAFTAYHAYQALLTHIPVSVINAIAVIYGFAAVFLEYHRHLFHYSAFLVFAGIWNLLYMVFSIIACIKARKGRFYYFWIFGRLAFAKYYMPSANKKLIEEDRNLPPEGL
jgi:uncharacterized Tic20 family protein